MCIIYIILFYVYNLFTWIYVYMCSICVPCALRGQEKASEPLKLTSYRYCEPP